MPPGRGPVRCAALGDTARIAVRGIARHSSMHKYVLIAVAAVAVLVVAPKAARGFLKWRTHENLRFALDQVRMPHVVSDTTTETRAELGDQVLHTWYTLNLTFENDEATRAAFAVLAKDSACRDQAPREFLSRGYSLDRTYTVPTPHGTDTFKVLITPADCPGVLG